MAESDRLVQAVVKAAKDGHKVLIAGNGGLAAEASHFAAELMGEFAFPAYIPCISLSDNSPLLSALANDIGWTDAYARIVSVLGERGDVFIGMTTSQSVNIIKALEAAKRKGLVVVAICGERFSFFSADVVITVEGEGVAEVQNNVIQYLHKVAYEVKREVDEHGCCLSQPQ